MRHICRHLIFAEAFDADALCATGVKQAMRGESSTWFKE